MEQRGAPLAALAPLDDLAQLAAQPGPFLTVYLPLRPATDERAQAAALVWRGMRGEAEVAGAPPALLEAVDERIADLPRDVAGVCVVAAESGAIHVEHLATPPEPHAAWAPAPALVPLIEARQHRQPYVVALVDRQGADLAAYDGGAEGADETGFAVSVDGDAQPVHKAAGGGWSQRRFQQRAEESWHRNMAEVADDLLPLVALHDARLVAVGGDERAVGLLSEALPTATRELVRPIEVTRAPDGSGDQLDDELDRVVTEWTDEQLGETLAAYHREQGQRDRAVTGAADTDEALRMARVATLVVPAEDDAGTADAGVVDQMVVAALTSGADVQVVPQRLGPPGEIAALLRW